MGQAVDPVSFPWETHAGITQHLHPTPSVDRDDRFGAKLGARLEHKSSTLCSHKGLGYKKPTERGLGLSHPSVSIMANDGTWPAGQCRGRRMKKTTPRPSSLAQLSITVLGLCNRSFFYSFKVPFLLTSIFITREKICDDKIKC